MQTEPSCLLKTEEEESLTAYHFGGFYQTPSPEKNVQVNPYRPVNKPIEAVEQSEAQTADQPITEVSEGETSKPSSLNDQPLESINEPKPIVEPPQLQNRNYLYPVPQRFSLRVIEKNGIGYKTGYSTLEALFAPTYQLGKVLPLVDVRVHHFDCNLYAANLGLIGRSIPLSSCMIVGFNAYYDYRQSCCWNYQQIGLGLEFLGQRLDFRLNGYISIGEKEHKTQCKYDEYSAGYFAIYHKKETALQGCNAELGCQLIASKNFLLYAAAGPYFLSGGFDKHTWGVKARLTPQYKDLIALNLIMSSDRLFHTLYQAEISFSLPFYPHFCKKIRKSACISDRRIYQPVQRFEIIPLKGHSHWQTNF